MRSRVVECATGVVAESAYGPLVALSFGPIGHIADYLVSKSNSMWTSNASIRLEWHFIGVTPVPCHSGPASEWAGGPDFRG